MDENLEWKTYDNMQPREKALVKNKPVNPKVKVVEPEVPKVETQKETEIKPGVLSDVQLREIMDEAYINHGAITWSDDAAEAFLAKRNARAMYMPSQPGKPGTLIFSKSATPAEVAEEMLHLQQHKSLRFAQLTTAQFIELELEAQRELLAYARRSGMDADAVLFEENLAYWQKQKAQLELGGDAARVVEKEVDGFKMVDEPGNYYSPTEEELETIVVEQFQNDKPLDVIANSSVYGSKGLQGDTFIYDLVGIYSIDKTNLNVNLFAVLSEISKQAIELKAKRIVFNGYAVINDDFNKFLILLKGEEGVH